jgi:hypothetical protein
LINQKISFAREVVPIGSDIVSPENHIRFLQRVAVEKGLFVDDLDSIPGDSDHAFNEDLPLVNRIAEHDDVSSYRRPIQQPFDENGISHEQCIFHRTGPIAKWLQPYARNGESGNEREPHQDADNYEGGIFRLRVRFSHKLFPAKPGTSVSLASYRIA